MFIARLNEINRISASKNDGKKCEQNYQKGEWNIQGKAIWSRCAHVSILLNMPSNNNCITRNRLISVFRTNEPKRKMRSIHEQKRARNVLQDILLNKVRILRSLLLSMAYCVPFFFLFHSSLCLSAALTPLSVRNLFENGSFVWRIKWAANNSIIIDSFHIESLFLNDRLP